MVDTALCATLTKAADLLLADLDAFVAALKARALELLDVPVTGRTHGMHAEPTTFGAKFALWALQADRDRRRLRAAREAVAGGQALGRGGHVLQHRSRGRGPGVRRAGPDAGPRHPGHRPRPPRRVLLRLRRHRLDRRADVHRDPPPGPQRGRGGRGALRAGQKGSSAMPHKRNPILSERLCGLARLFRGYLGAGLEDVALWHERDISHSSVERVALPDASLLASYVLRKATGLAQGLVIHPERARENLVEGSLGLVFSQSVLLALVSAGLTRDEAYRIVQRDARAAWAERRAFRAVLESDPEVTLTPGQLDDAFDLEPHPAPHRPLRRRPRGSVTASALRRRAAPGALGQGPRALRRRRRPPAHGGLGPGQRVRRGHGRAHPRQGPGAHRHDLLLERGDGRRGARAAGRGGSGGDRGGARRRASRPAWRAGPTLVRRAEMLDSSASCAATWPGRPGRSTSGRGRCTARPAAGPAAGQPVARAHVHPVDQGRRGPRPQHRLRGGRRPGGREVAEAARAICLELYPRAAARAAEAGFVLADTKFELGYVDGVLCLCDEVVTPDSSRLWPADQVVPGTTPPAFDKQPLRDWLAAQPWDRTPPPPPLPPEVVDAMSARYVAAYERVTGRRLADWYGATT